MLICTWPHTNCPVIFRFLAESSNILEFRSSGCVPNPHGTAKSPCGLTEQGLLRDSLVHIEGWEPDGCKWHFWWNGYIYIYIYIYQMKALNELFLLVKVLSSMSAHIFIINNWNKYTKLDHNFYFGSPAKLAKCHLRPFWFSPLYLQLEKWSCDSKSCTHGYLREFEGLHASFLFQVLFIPIAEKSDI